MVQQLAQARSPETCPLRYTPGLEAVWVAMEEASLRTVVRNLLDNAHKYGSTGAAIEVRVQARDGRAILTVQDFGLGLEASETEAIFERFYRVGDEMVRRHEGSGLGLYLVRLLLADYGGRITVDSAGLGQGATFVVSLPQIPGELA
jgi:signal transduction histidine kinase